MVNVVLDMLPQYYGINYIKHGGTIEKFKTSLKTYLFKSNEVSVREWFVQHYIISKIAFPFFLFLLKSLETLPKNGHNKQQ